MKYVLGFMFNEDLTKVVLIEKTKPDWQKGLLNGVGGKIEPFEQGIDAIIREVEEECGLKSAWFDWKYGLSMKSDDWQVEVFYTNYLDINQIQTLTEEVVGIYDVDYILTNRHLSISNIP